MKKKFIITALALMVILALGLGTTAYFSKSGTAESVVSASNLKVELVMTDNIDGEEVPVEGTTDIMPGEYVPRTAAVENKGKETAWVRVKAPEAGVLELTEINEQDWTLKDGYWYCNEKLESGKTTAPLFYGIRVSEEAGNENAGKVVNLDLRAEATQYEHNGDDVFAAQGWPEE